MLTDVGSQCGSLLIPHLRGPTATYAALTVLIVAHLLLNYFAVKGVVLRSLNRQRTSILLSAFRAKSSDSKGASTVITPAQVAAEEQIYRPLLVLRAPSSTSQRPMSGFCILGASLGMILRGGSKSVPRLGSRAFKELLAFQQDAKYILWASAPSARSALPYPKIIIVLKEGHTQDDHLQAWLHATELSYLILPQSRPGDLTAAELLGLIRKSKETVQELLPTFLEGIKAAGWRLDAAAGGLLTGSPRTIHFGPEDRKTR